MENWKRNLIPFDLDMCRMVTELTGIECEPKNGGDHYFIEADYANHPQPEYILGMWDAIEGRAGNRLLEIRDDSERHCLFVRIKFASDFDGMHPVKLVKDE